MKSILVNVWAEILKVRKSGVFWISLVFFVFISLMMGLMMYIQQHPEISHKLGIIGAKASMFEMGEANRFNYFTLLTQIAAGVGMVGYGFVTSWVFGCEYTGKTLKDMLALPVTRVSIVIAKMIVVILWSIILAAVFLLFSGLFGHLAGLSGWSTEGFSKFFGTYTMVTLLTIVLCTPVAFLASYSGGILLPVGFIILTVIMANFTGLIGPVPYFPWAILGLFCIDPANTQIDRVSYIILFLTGMAGLTGTLACWQYADQK